eukprot:m.455882 g.455882  ORF g.455882 m.455882 type:complete len:425 (+) comp20953_c0_seq1:11-1285(+)
MSNAMAWFWLGIVFSVLVHGATGILDAEEPLAAATTISLREQQFLAFMQRHGKEYATEEERRKRFNSFVANLKQAEALNAAPHDHGHTAVFGVNKFSDLHPHEVVHLFTGAKSKPDGSSPSQCTQPIACCSSCPKNTSMVKGPTPPPRLDWREFTTASGLPVVTPVVNQGHCGSCWAFSSVASIETAWLLAGNPPVGPGGALSVQRVLDCVYPLMNKYGADYPHGVPNCSGGGLVQEALEYGLNYGVPAAGSDPYACGGGCADGTMMCKAPLPVTRPDSFTPPSGNTKSWITQCCGSSHDFLCNDAPNTKAIMRASATYGLMTINVNARNWVGYTAGIIRNHCDPKDMNHAVILAGYGTDIVDGEEIDYWLIRNSWGTEWGEEGYGRLYRDNSTNVCGFATEMWLASANRSESLDGPMYIDECT